MKKILFDASVHLGQFDIQDDSKRIWCRILKSLFQTLIQKKKYKHTTLTMRMVGWMPLSGV